MTELPKNRRTCTPPLFLWLTTACAVVAFAACALAPAAESSAEATTPAKADGAPDPEGKSRNPAPDAYAHYCMAMSLVRAGEGRRALEELQKVVELDPAAHRAWYQLGSLHKARAKLGKAEECYARAVELKPDDFRSLFELGRAKLLLGRGKDGLKMWHRAAESTEGSSAAFIYESIARYYQGHNDPDKAIDTLRKALETTEEPMRVATSLADLQRELHKWPDAIDTYKHMLKLDPQAPGLHLKIAKCYEEQERWEDALAEYDAHFAAHTPSLKTYPLLAHSVRVAQNAGIEEKAQAYLKQSVDVLDRALTEGSRNATVYSELAKLLKKTGQTQKAIDTLTRGLENAAGKTAVEIHKVLADVYLGEAMPARGEAQLLAAVKVDPENPRLHEKLATFYNGMLRFEAAAGAMAKAVDLAHGHSQLTPRARLAGIYVEMKEYSKAEAQLEVILKDAPEAAAAWAGLGQVKKKAGKLEEAAQALEKALELGAPGAQTETGWRLKLADTYAALGRPEQEKQQQEKIDALATDPMAAIAIAYVLYEGRHYEHCIGLIKARIGETDPLAAGPARSILSLCYQETGKIDLAEKELRTMIQEDPANPRSYRQMAHFLEKQKRYDEAFEVLKGALRPNAGDEEALIIRLAEASLLDQTGQFDQAEEKYKEILEEYPDNATVNNNFGYFYAQRGRELETALKMVKKALQAEPDTAAFLDTLGWVLYKSGKYEGAVLKIHRAYQIQKDAVIAEHLADALAKLGRKAQALEKYKRALELDPDSEALQQKIKEAQKLTRPLEAE